ncbi:unnamed protein product (macronuclear) [Paramecium tetraurelia]|uniref:Uncharacterized protein n=1 Tax=Paramecium tetraurelia TaxID=5888 RepID=A0CFK0_PARTE|nr:uncharacterized protein GSPATT00038007001 [Paramecium tetraurelia]CAK69567.1 unnamed protein product [Paramecium tetraurelia]|eukprot:XP_001436964.1 hypothetical protein (macronuclear) [Paramecium tetraurelia strain d4-2]
MVLPFKTIILNQLEQKSTLLCTFTLFAVLSLSQTSSFYTLVVLSIIITNIYLLMTFIQSLIKGYLESQEELIDNIKDHIREKLKQKVQYHRFLESWLVNKGQRRKIVIERFKQIKKYLFEVRQKCSRIERQKFSQISTYRSSSGFLSPRDFNLVLLKPQQILSTNSENNPINDPLTNLIKKKSQE